jgi:hypothetical protein
LGQDEEVPGVQDADEEDAAAEQVGVRCCTGGPRGGGGGSSPAFVPKGFATLQGVVSSSS